MKKLYIGSAYFLMSKKILVYFFPIFVFICVVIGVHLYFTSGARADDPIPFSELLTEASTTEISTSTTTHTTTTTTTSTSTTTTTTTVTTTVTTTAIPVTEPEAAAEEPETDTAPTAAPAEVPQTDTSFTPVGVSPNSQFYQDRLVVAGDSIASGYYYYGYIPEGHNLAQSSLSIWNFEYFTFNVGGTMMNISDGINALKPKLILFSVGMNDINCTSTDAFTQKYRSKIELALQQVPDTNIVVSGITPIAPSVTYTTNETIQQYNAALKAMVESMGSSRVYFFDTFPVLADPSTNALKDSFSSGDGMHLASKCYADVLAAMFNFLDTTPVYDQIVQSEQ